MLNSQSAWQKVVSLVKKKTFLSTALGIGFLAAGIVGMSVLMSLRKAPAEASMAHEEQAIHVEVIEVQPANEPVTISGFGVVRPLEVVEVAPEVGGTVIRKHPDLVAGGIIPKGEVLFAIDPAPYEARVRDAEAVVAQWDTTVERLHLEWENEKARLESLRRGFELAKADYDRAKKSTKQGIGSQSDVDKAERAFVDASEQLAAVERSLSLYPVRIRETENNLNSAQQKLAVAEMDLEKTRVTVPFTARAKSVDVARDEFIMVGERAATLANDTVLEIWVPLDSREARRWLRFDATNVDSDQAWFTSIEQVPCEIRWSENPKGHVWYGRLNRVISFEEETRTLTVAVRIGRKEAVAGDGETFPLVEGMFCNVSIPGREMKDVIAVPQGTVTIENTVYTVQDGRLRTVPVTVERARDETMFIGAGLKPGDQVITTRLVNPLENTRCEIVTKDAASESD